MAEDHRRTSRTDSPLRPNGAAAKNKTPVRENSKSQWGNPHRKRQIHSGETRTTGHSGETHTTLDISGQVGQEAKLEPAVSLKVSVLARRRPQWSGDTVPCVAIPRMRT